MPGAVFIIQKNKEKVIYVIVNSVIKKVKPLCMSHGRVKPSFFKKRFLRNESALKKMEDE